MSEAVQEHIGRIVKASYGKLLAFLSSRTRDIQASEDALSQALEKALERWPVEGLPPNPEAWLMHVARNVLKDHMKHRVVVEKSLPTLLQMDEEKIEGWPFDQSFQDERLKLLFICAHPAIDSAIRTPLMLQTVLGLDAKFIASSYLMTPAAMSKKLTRAKEKIKQTCIEFEVPEPKELGGRLDDVLEAIFAAFGQAWDALGSVHQRWKDLNREALDLAELVCRLLPDEPEPKGLWALLLFCESRKQARRGHEDVFIPLDQQDPSLWNQTMIAQAEARLAQAFASGKIGRFQLEAAIQSAHTHRLSRRINNWQAILTLYNGLLQGYPTLGAYVSRAIVLNEVEGPNAGLDSLLRLEQDMVASYQPYWVVLANLHQHLGQKSEASAAYNRAIGLSDDVSIRVYLQNQLKNLQGSDD